MNRIETQVLIVGGGPTGLTAALLLSRLGIASHIVERRQGPQRAPAAHVVNARSFEIWRQAGADVAALLAAAQDPRDAGHVYFVTRLGGEVLGGLPFERQGEDVLALTPTPLRNLSQHRLEPLLLDQVTRAGVTVHYRHRWEAAEQGVDGVTSRLRDLGSDDVYEVRSRYLIAADGAGSPVRKSLGIDMLGIERLQSFIMIHFEADLRGLLRDCPGVLYWIGDPACPGAFVAHDIDREWVFMHPWDSDQEAVERYDAAHCESLVRRAMARSDLPLTIRTVAPWVMASQTAERYRDWRILLAGDAAHRFPPSGGLGLNTGVQDAHNLAWKIAAIEHGWADPRLLDTYEQERLPIARYNAEQSLRNAMRIFEVTQAIGVDADLDRSRQLFAEMLVDPDRRRAVAAAIEGQAEHFDMLGLQLGYAYETGALLADGTAPPPVANPVRDYIPSSRPGSRLPHGWVECDGRRLSTLDLVAPDRFTLFVGPQGGAWRGALDNINAPTACVQLGVDVADPDDWWSTIAAMDPGGALLVRPDQHVALRASGAADDAAAILERGLATILGAAAAALCHTAAG